VAAVSVIIECARTRSFSSARRDWPVRAMQPYALHHFRSRSGFLFV